MDKKWRSAIAFAAGGLVVAAAIVAPSAMAEGTDSTKAATPSVAVHQLDAGTAEWTPAAMRTAIPLDRLLPKVDPSEVTHDVRQGKPQVVAPTVAPAEVEPMAFPHPGGPWSGGGAVENTAGRVFFTYQGRQASCSGNAVTSGNKSVVMTAGHCVKLEGAWHTDWVFVPAYDNGNAPFGQWAAKTTLTTPQWEASEDINYDVGAAVVEPLNGQSLTDVVGGQGVAFNQARGQDMYAFGWPAADPYDGTQMIYCSGTTFDALISDGIGMTCDMTGGSSGGPWFQEFDEGTGAGVQNSVNSYKINFIPTWMFGPYFGADAQGVYNAAQAG